MHGTCTGEKSLPKSPRKKVEIISKLATKYKIKIKLKENRGRKPNPMDQNGEQFLITLRTPEEKIVLILAFLMEYAPINQRGT